MESIYCERSECPIPGAGKGRDPVIAKTDEKAHTILCASVSRLPVQTNSGKQINSTSYGIYRLQLSPHGKFILYTALPTLLLMKLRQHWYTHFTTRTSEAHGGWVACSRSRQESFTGPAVRRRLLHSWSGNQTMMPLTVLQQTTPRVINLGSRNALNHSRIMTFLWEDNTSLLTWKLGEEQENLPKLARKAQRRGRLTEYSEAEAGRQPRIKQPRSPFPRRTLLSFPSV